MVAATTDSIKTWLIKGISLLKKNVGTPPNHLERSLLGIFTLRIQLIWRGREKMKIMMKLGMKKEKGKIELRLPSSSLS